jgi:hypothetical protein
MEGKRIRGEGNGIGEATQRMTLRMLWILGLEGWDGLSLDTRLGPIRINGNRIYPLNLNRPCKVNNEAMKYVVMIDGHVNDWNGIVKWVMENEWAWNEKLAESMEWYEVCRFVGF